MRQGWRERERKGEEEGGGRTGTKEGVRGEGKGRSMQRQGARSQRQETEENGFLSSAGSFSGFTNACTETGSFCDARGSYFPPIARVKR